MTKELAYRLEFSNLRVTRNHSLYGITLSGVMRNGSGQPLLYETLPFLRYGGNNISTRKLVDDRLLHTREYLITGKFCLSPEYSAPFSIDLIRPTNGWDNEFYMLEPASTNEHQVLVEGLDRLYDLPLVLAKMDATPNMPQIDSFDLDLDEFLQRMNPLLNELSSMDAASARRNLPTTHSAEPSLVFTDVTVRESEPPTPSYNPYDMPKARLEVCGTVTNVSQRLLSPNALPALVNDITYRDSLINFGNKGLRQVEVARGIWGSNMEPGQTLPFSYVVPINPVYHFYPERGGSFLYSVQSGWRFTATDIVDQSRPFVAYQGLEGIPKQIEESLRRIHGADHSENALFSDLVASGRTESELRRLVQGGPYWIAPHSESAYAFHCSSSCPTLARSWTQVVDGFYIATTHYSRCYVCGGW